VCMIIDGVVPKVNEGLGLEGQTTAVVSEKLATKN